MSVELTNANVGPAVDGGQPGGQSLDRAHTLARIIHDLDVARQRGKSLTGRPDHYHRSVGDPRDNADGPPQQS